MERKPCGLIAVIPPALQKEWAEHLTALARRFRPAALIFREPEPGILAQAIAAAQAVELAILLTDDAEAARAACAGGVYLTMPGADMAKARAVLGNSGIAGAACGLSRHAAMESAEAGADFVVFDASGPATRDKAFELSLWWDEITGVPGALAYGSARPDRSVLSKARPDFILIEETASAGESLIFAAEIGLQSQM